jgi:hypothetical protein
LVGAEAATTPHTLRRPPYNLSRDFMPIGTIAKQVYVPVAPTDALG